MNANLLPDTYAWFRDLEIRRARTKTVAVTASLAALRMQPREQQDEMIQWARLIDDGIVTWVYFEKVCGETDKRRLEALKRTLERAVRVASQTRPQ